MRWEPDRRSYFFFSPPSHLCAVTYMTEISLIVTLNKQFNSTQLKKKIWRWFDFLLQLWRIYDKWSMWKFHLEVLVTNINIARLRLLLLQSMLYDNNRSLSVFWEISKRLLVTTNSSHLYLNHIKGQELYFFPRNFIVKHETCGITLSWAVKPNMNAYRKSYCTTKADKQANKHADKTKLYALLIWSGELQEAPLRVKTVYSYTCMHIIQRSYMCVFFYSMQPFFDFVPLMTNSLGNLYEMKKPGRGTCQLISFFITSMDKAFEVYIRYIFTNLTVHNSIANLQ